MAKSKVKEKEAGVFVNHCQCPKCDSVDNGAVYEHEDGSHSFTCFGGSCGHSIVEFDITTMKEASGGSRRVIDMEAEMEKLEEIRDSLSAETVPERKIGAETYDLYGVRMEYDSTGETLEAVYYPTYIPEDRERPMDNLKHVGYRNRKRFKEWHDAVKKKPELNGVLKDFAGGVGFTKKSITMFGQWLFPSGGKRIIVVAGEEDTVATYRMLELVLKEKGRAPYPVVGTPSGENVASCQPNIQYLNSFEEIVIIRDNDSAGEKFATELAKKLKAGAVTIITCPNGAKDPSALWTSEAKMKDRMKLATKLYHAIFNGQKYSPAGIMSLSAGWKEYIGRGREILIPFPKAFRILNEKTFGGYALGEIVNIIAPSSVGKSSVVKEMIYTALTETQYKIGVLSLEETIGEFIEGILSIHMETQLNEIPYDMRDRGAEYEKFKELVKLRPEAKPDEVIDNPEGDRIEFLNHQGSCSGEDLLEKVDFLINGLDCKIIILDPVTLAISGRDTDEDEMASDILKRVKKHNLAWVNVHHVRKNSNGSTANSEGGDLAEEDIKGSGAWFQQGMINLIFTRNKVHEIDEIKNTMRCKMSKCRRHGKSTGICGYQWYNGATGRLEEGRDPEVVAQEHADGGGSAHDPNDGFEMQDSPLSSFGEQEKLLENAISNEEAEYLARKAEHRKEQEVREAELEVDSDFEDDFGEGGEDSSEISEISVDNEAETA